MSGIRKLNPIIESRKYLTITVRDSVEEAISPEESLPQSEPPTKQYVRTLDQTDMPIYSTELFDVKHVGHIIIGTKNFGSVDHVVNYASYKNGNPHTSGSTTVNDGDFCTFQQTFYDCDIGDTLSLAIWCTTSSDVKMVYKARTVTLSRPRPEENGLLLNVDMGSNGMGKAPTAVLGNDPYIAGYHFRVGVSTAGNLFSQSTNSYTTSHVIIDAIDAGTPLMYDYYTDTGSGSSSAQNDMVLKKSVSASPYLIGVRYPTEISYNVLRTK